MPRRRLSISLYSPLVFLISVGHAFSQNPLPPILHGPTSSEAGTVNEAIVVLQELTTNAASGIPAYLLKDAQALAIIPHYINGAFVIGVAGGRGLLVTRNAAGQWQAPEFMSLAGGSIGWQAGVQSTDLVLVFRTSRSVPSIRQGKLTLGADVSAAAGPVGRFASAATDVRLQSEILTYSRSRGLFAGVSLSGASLQLDPLATQRYYQVQPNGGAVVPQSVGIFIHELNRVTGPLAADPAGGNAEAAWVPVQRIDIDANSATSDTLVQLRQSVAQLQVKVDDQWKQYLALPSSMQPGQPMLIQELDSTLIRYERVATNPSFESLRVLPDFQQSLDLLRKLSIQVREANPLPLPPPPAVEGATGTRGRY